MKILRLSSIFLASGLIFVAACVRNPATRKVNARLLSPEAERKIGEAAKKEILEQYKVIKSTAVTDYVNRVGQRLARVCDRPTVDYDFTVLDNDLINAFAVPGGFIFVTRGLLENTNDEAELAMVLGHEVAHVAALHGVQMIQKEMGQNALTILGAIGTAITAGPEAMLMVANTAQLFSSLYMLGYSREKELEADNLGLQYLLRAGYDPQASLRFFRHLQQVGGDEAQGWDLYFRTHPNTSERISIIEGMIGAGQQDQARSHVAEFQQIKALLPKVDVRERGQISGQIYRNDVYQLSLDVPTNWVLGYYYPQALIGFRTTDALGEGRVQVVQLSSSAATAEDLARDYSSAAGFQLQSGHNVLYQAGYGYLGQYLGASPGGKILAIRLFATVRHGRGFILMAGADAEKSDNYVLDLERIVRALRFQDIKEHDG